MQYGWYEVPASLALASICCFSTGRDDALYITVLLPISILLDGDVLGRLSELGFIHS